MVEFCFRKIIPKHEVGVDCYMRIYIGYAKSKFWMRMFKDLFNLFFGGVRDKIGDSSRVLKFPKQVALKSPLGSPG